MGIHFDDVYYTKEDAGKSAMMASAQKPDRIQYLEYIRGTVFGSNPLLEVVKCRKYPEFGQILRGDIADLIERLEFCQCGGEGCQYCIPQLGLDKEDEVARVIESDAFDPKGIVGKQVEVRMNRDQMLDPEFYARQAAQMLAIAETLRAVPQSDVFPDGSILTFEKQFVVAPMTSTAYKYVALKENGLWFVTGSKSPNGIFWGALVTFIGVQWLHTLRVLTDTYGVTTTEYQKGIEDALKAEGNK